MISPEAALRLVLERVVVREEEMVPHADALGRVLARDVASQLALPPFDNSAMDGFAVIASDLSAASQTASVTLQLAGIIGAGEEAQQPLSPDQCLKIMTGAPIPTRADAVVMREEVRQTAENIEFFQVPRSGENIRRMGSDVAQGETVLRAGTVIGAAQWAMLASLGEAQIAVRKRPRVGIIVTGAELVAVEASLAPGQIRDSNSFALRALTRNCGAEVVAVRQSGDTLEEFAAVLREVAAQCDFVITSGGVSAGDFDPVRDVLRDQAQVFFWKIAMKPGKPVMFASFEGTPVLGLPGNPASAMVSFEILARPALLHMGGRRALQRLEVPVRLQTSLRSQAGRTEFARCTVKLEGGQWQADFPGDQGSGRLSTMTNANALLVVPAETTWVEAGAMLMARLIECPEIE